MKYVKELEAGFSWETEKIEWLEYNEAKEKLGFEKEKEILAKARELLNY